VQRTEGRGEKEGGTSTDKCGELFDKLLEAVLYPHLSNHSYLEAELRKKRKREEEEKGRLKKRRRKRE